MLPEDALVQSVSAPHRVATCAALPLPPAPSAAAAAAPAPTARGPCATGYPGTAGAAALPAPRRDLQSTHRYPGLSWCDGWPLAWRLMQWVKGRRLRMQVAPCRFAGHALAPWLVTQHGGWCASVACPDGIGLLLACCWVRSVLMPGCKLRCGGVGSLDHICSHCLELAIFSFSGCAFHLASSRRQIQQSPHFNTSASRDRQPRVRWCCGHNAHHCMARAIFFS